MMALVCFVLGVNVAFAAGVVREIAWEFGLKRWACRTAVTLWTMMGVAALIATATGGAGR